MRSPRPFPAPVPGAGERSDAELVRLARRGDDLALADLLTRHRGFARTKARTYFLVGAEAEDLVQEAMIGLYKAVRDFDPDRDVAFRSFAEVCVTRQLITAIKAANRHKHGPLNASISLDRRRGPDDERALGDTLAAPRAQDPAELVISAERIRALQRHLDAVLSDLEVEVLRLFVAGKSYGEIAACVDRHVKAVDNALQRAKRKIDEHLRERELAEAG